MTVPGSRVNARQYALPAVHVAAARNLLLLERFGFAHGSSQLSLTALTVVLAYFTADATLLGLALMVVGSSLCGTAIIQLRSFGDRYHLVSEAREHLDDHDRWFGDAMARAITAESRVILWRAAAGLVLATAAAWLTNRVDGRWWVIACCTLFLLYVKSSVQFVSERSLEVGALVKEAAASGCAIGLFRSFRSQSEALLLNVLAPLLQGYGEVRFVGGPAGYEHEPSGLFGREGVPLSPIPQFAIDEWRDRVRRIIEEVDIAVIDISATTDGVMWEVAQCYSVLPRYRVLLIVNGNDLSQAGFEAFTEEFRKQLRRHPEMPTDVRPWMFLFTPGVGHDLVLAQAIHLKMLEIIEIEGATADSPAF